jgi:hypothetical protein
MKKFLVLLLVLPAPGRAADGAGLDPGGESDPDRQSMYRWFELPIEVSGLPGSARFMPLSAAVDFTKILGDLGVEGAVDERSLRLWAIFPGGREEEQPLQFSSSPQRRPQRRRLLEGTTPSVSYVGEYRAGETPAVPRVAGELAWMAGSAPGAARRYRLEFGVLKRGRFIQVPYPPWNLRAFDDQGRAAAVRWFPRLQIRPQWPFAGVLHVLEDNQLVTSYHTGPTVAGGERPAAALRRPFFYPVNGPDGVSLTEFGKPHDPTGSHGHHYSLWIAHASVNGRDFWSERGGRILNERFDLLEDGPVFCRMVQRTQWQLVDPARAGEESGTLLRGRREFKFYTLAADIRLLDVSLELTAGGKEPVTLGQTTFGFLAVRVAQSMTVFDGGGEIINARGQRNEQGAHRQRAEWIDLSGPVAPGRWGGIAILDHPENPRHPTGWHCRNDGWAGASFNMDGPHTLKPGEKLELRYRVLLHRRDAARANVAGCYEEYRAKPAVRLGEATEKDRGD